MKELTYKGIIEDVRFGKCTKFELESLVTIFELAVNRMKIDSEFYQSLKDVGRNVNLDVSQFSLEIVRKTTKDKIDFIGEFKHNNKRLKIIAFKKF